jgi:hypothetical protein
LFWARLSFYLREVFTKLCNGMDPTIFTGFGIGLANRRVPRQSLNSDRKVNDY